MSSVTNKVDKAKPVWTTLYESKTNRKQKTDCSLLDVSGLSSIMMVYLPLSRIPSVSFLTKEWAIISSKIEIHSQVR